MSLSNASIYLLYASFFFLSFLFSEKQKSFIEHHININLFILVSSLYTPRTHRRLIEQVNLFC